jgi:hypothetical protein
VGAALNELTNEFIRNPMRFFSEKDFHWYFCHLLDMDKLVETRFKGYKTTIVHQEYGTVEGRGKRLDIAVLDPAEVKEIDGLDLKRGGEFLHPLAAIEFGTEKTPDLPKHIKDDCDKLKSSGAKNGYIAVYYKDRTESGKGWRFEKHRKRVEDIKREIEKAQNTYELNVFCVIHHINERRCDKYEDGAWKSIRV